MVKVPTILPILIFLVVTVESASNEINQEHPKSTSDGSVSAVGMTDEVVHSARTLVAMTIMRWTMNIFKAMVKPARDMYLMLTPEISAFRCLSESREVQSMFGYDEDTDFEGYHYDTPRVDEQVNRVLKRMPRFIDGIASLLKDGSTMSCVVPYMRERVVRWLDG